MSGPSRVSITMSDFTKLIHKYIDVSQSNIVVDVGSLNGDDAEFIVKAFPHMKGYAIEGLPENYEKYIKHKTNITGIQRVIASYNGEIKFHQKRINGIHGIYDRGQEYGTIVNTYMCSTLEAIMDEYAIQTFDIMKIDVEGATYDALQSLGTRIQSVKIMHIETESYPFFEGQVLHDKVCELLESHDFTVVDMTSVEITPKRYQLDSVWVNSKFKKTL